VFATHAPRPLIWRAFATNSAVLTVAAVALAVSPATVSFPIAVAEALVLAGGLAATLGVNLAVLPRAVTAAPCADHAPSEPGPGPSRDRVRQVLVCWSRPYRLTVEDAEEWLAAELERVLAAEGVELAHLTRLREASARYGAPHAWLLELDVPTGRDPQTWLDSPAWTEWLGDLHALGMRPGTMLADRGRVVTAEVD
jgi:hypothetical protein